MQNIISKLNMLKTVHPSESWVFETRKRVLSEAPFFVVKELDYSSRHINNKKSIFNLNNLFASKLTVAFSALVFVLLSGFSAVYASKSSLPGDALYAVKIASESVELAVASEGDKGKIEVQQVGNRVEELAKVSQNISDSKQEEKIAKLYEEINVKSKKVSERLTQPKDNAQTEKTVSTAKVANNQYEKYGEVLAQITENMPDSMKEKVSSGANSALVSAEKVNFNSLMIIVENNASNNSGAASDEEIKNKLKKIIDKEKEKKAIETENGETIKDDISTIPAVKELEVKIIEDNKTVEKPAIPAIVEEKAIIAPKETKEELLAGAEESLENGDLAGAAKNIAAAMEIDEKNKVDEINKTVEINEAEKINAEIMPVPAIESVGEVKGVVDSNIREIKK